MRRGIGNCEVCQFTYCPDIRDDVAAHRRRHREHLRFTRPYRDRRLNPSDPWATWLAPRWKHRILHQFARRFRREMRFDFVQWPERFEYDDDKPHGFIFMDDIGRAVGGCGFSWVEWTNAPACWVLSWVYVVPPMRRQGVLRRHWQTFRDRFGDFWIDPPLSDAMEAFARKHAAPTQYQIREMADRTT